MNMCERVYLLEEELARVVLVEVVRVQRGPRLVLDARAARRRRLEQLHLDERTRLHRRHEAAAEDLQQEEHMPASTSTVHVRLM